jgi:hypothetical protein
MSDLPPPLPGSGAESAPIPPSVGYESTTLVDRDAEHLKVLSICWYVVAGLNVLFGCFPLIYVVMGVAIMTTGAGSRPGEPPAAVMGAVFAAIGGAISILIWTGALLAFLTARALRNRNRLVLCYITAGLACLNVPIGTVLGVFTFLILARPTVRSQFA